MRGSTRVFLLSVLVATVAATPVQADPTDPAWEQVDRTLCTLPGEDCPGHDSAVPDRDLPDPEVDGPDCESSGQFGPGSSPREIARWIVEENCTHPVASGVCDVLQGGQVGCSQDNSQDGLVQSQECAQAPGDVHYCVEASCDTLTREGPVCNTDGGNHPGSTPQEQASSVGFEMAIGRSPEASATDRPSPRSATGDRSTITRPSDPSAGSAPTGESRVAPWVVAGAVGLLIAFAWLYRRVTKDEALDNDLRSAILDRVQATPGVAPAEIADDLDVALNTVLYHARILEEMDFLRIDDSGRPNRLYADGCEDQSVSRLRSLLRRDGKGDLLRIVRREPGIRLAELARRLDCHPSTAKRHADALIEDGVLDDDRSNGARRFLLRDAVADADVWEHVDNEAA